MCLKSAGEGWEALGIQDVVAMPGENDKVWFHNVMDVKDEVVASLCVYGM